MALNFPYRFAVAMYAEDGTSLGTVPAKCDWESMHEWTRFYFQRRGQLPLAGNGSASVLPLWEHTMGEPYCRGYRVQIEQAGRQPVASDFPNTYFRDFASIVASVFVEKKKLKVGEYYSYLVVAHPAPVEAPQTGGLSVADASPGVPAQDASLAHFLSCAKPSGVIDIDDMPVFVHRRVLHEAAELTRAVRGTETGSILIGRLWRDAAAGEIFAEITAQIPCEYTSGNSVKLTFTPQTWSAAEAALRLRNRGEVYLGWFHSHPVFNWKCKDCPPEAQRNCYMAKDFFSEDDIALSRSAFPRAYNVAIVANDTAFTDLTFSMFGNREGVIQPRGFYVLEGETRGA